MCVCVCESNVLCSMIQLEKKQKVKPQNAEVLSFNCRKKCGKLIHDFVKGLCCIFI